MAYDTRGFTIEEALARSQDVFEVDVAEWGDTVASTGSLRFPAIGQRGIPSSLAGIAIGPRSTIDHAWVTWFRDKELTASPDGVPNAVVSAARYVSSEAPLMYTQRAAPGTAINKPNPNIATGLTINERDALRLGALYVYPVGPTGPFTPGAVGEARTGGSTLLPTQYLTQFNTLQAFTTAEAPFLQLTLYLKPPAFSPSPKRAPLVRAKGFVGAPAATPRLTSLLPIYGRKHVRVQAVSSANLGLGATGVFSLYAGLIRNINSTTLALDASAFAPVFEAPAGSVLTNPVGTVAALEISNPNADYLALYVDTPAGMTGAYTVVASD